MDWTREMNEMLSVFEHQAMRSLSIIKLAFRSNGMAFQTTFKEYFLRASLNRLSETFDRFEIKTQLDDEVLEESNDEADETERARTYNQSIRKVLARSQGNICKLEGFMETAYASRPSIPFDDSDDEEFIAEPVETAPIDNTTTVGSFVSLDGTESVMIATQNTAGAHNSNNGPLTADNLHEINESIAHQPNTNERSTSGPEVDSDLNFVVEIDESNDSIEMIENNNDSSDADNNENGNGMIKTAGTHLDPLNSIATNDKKSSSEQLDSRKIRCTVCDYSSYRKGDFDRHMRTHTGEKPYRCDRCGKGFTRTEILLKHTATHIAQFPFYCRACFHGFSLKTEVVAHEERCRKFHYECHLCKKFVTGLKPQLIAHMRKHTGDKPFRCEICTKHFSERGTLKHHLNTIHA